MEERNQAKWNYKWFQCKSHIDILAANVDFVIIATRYGPHKLKTEMRKRRKKISRKRIFCCFIWSQYNLWIHGHHFSLYFHFFCFFFCSVVSLSWNKQNDSQWHFVLLDYKLELFSIFGFYISFEHFSFFLFFSTFICLFVNWQLCDISYAIFFSEEKPIKNKFARKLYAA